MTQRPDLLRLSLGAQAEKHKTALVALVDAVRIYGRNGVPSISEMVRRVAVAYTKAPVTVAYHISEIMNIASQAERRDPMTRDEAGKIVSFRLYDDNGVPYTLRDTAHANPAEFRQFVAMFGGDDEEE